MNTTYSFTVNRPTPYSGMHGYSVSYHLHPGGVTGRVNRWNNSDFASSAPLTAFAGQLGPVLAHDVTGGAWVKPRRRAFPRVARRATPGNWGLPRAV